MNFGSTIDAIMIYCWHKNLNQSQSCRFWWKNSARTLEKLLFLWEQSRCKAWRRRLFWLCMHLPGLGPQTPRCRGHRQRTTGCSQWPGSKRASPHCLRTKTSLTIHSGKRNFQTQQAGTGPSWRHI